MFIFGIIIEVPTRKINMTANRRSRFSSRLRLFDQAVWTIDFQLLTPVCRIRDIQPWILNIHSYIPLRGAIGSRLEKNLDSFEHWIFLFAQRCLWSSESFGWYRFRVFFLFGNIAVTASGFCRIYRCFSPSWGKIRKRRITEEYFRKIHFYLRRKVDLDSYRFSETPEGCWGGN